MKALLLALLLYPAAAQADDRTKVITAIIQAADKVEVPRELLLALCWVESSYRVALPPHKDGSTPSYGICQVKLETAMFMDVLYNHKFHATAKKLQENLYINSFYAAKYLHYQLVRYHNDWQKAVTAYNKGSATTGHGAYWDRVNRAMKRKPQ